MRQLIARIDDDLHARLKERAARENRSMNALVTDVLEQAAPPLDARQRFRERVRAAGLLVEPPPHEGPVPSRDEVIESLRGVGRAVSEALEADRNHR